MVTKILIPYSNRVQWSCAVEVDVNLVVQLEEKLEIV